MTALIFIVLGVGIVLGFFVGRWSAERGRARFDMRGAWNGRTRYRE